MHKTRPHSTPETAGEAPETAPAACRKRGDRPGDRPDSTPGAAPTPKRLMVSRACDTCKLRKGKCTGTLPCASCTKKGIACRYESRYARGRPPTPVQAGGVPGGASTSFADGMSASSVSVSVYSPLQVVQPTPVAPPVPVPPAVQTVVRSTPERPYTASSAAGLPQPPQPPTVPSRASPVLGMTEIQGQYVEPTSGLAFLQRAWKRISRQRPGPGPGPGPGRLAADDDEAKKRTTTTAPASSSSSSSDDQPQDRAGDKAFAADSDASGLMVLPLPDLATCRQLVGYYHDLCVATYRFLHRPSVDAWLEQAHGNVAAGLPIEHGLGAMRAAVVLAVLAVAMFHRGKGEAARSEGASDEEADTISTRKSDRLFLASAKVAAAATGYPGLDSVQARLVQVLYLLHTSRLNQAWYVFGHALQTIAALGLHRRASRGRPSAKTTDYIESQCKKRAFWVAYILDTYLGIMFGRPRHFHDENIDQELPDAVNDEDMGPEGAYVREPHDCAMESLIYHARIGRIVGHISQSVYALNQDGGGDTLARVVPAIRADLAAWTASLPAVLSSVNPNSLVYPFRRQAITMRLARDHAVMHLNRPFLLRQMSTTGHRRDEDVAARAVADCIAAAREVLGIVDRMAQDGTLFYAFWWTHYVAFCALTVVYVWAIQRSGTHSAGDAAEDDAADADADLIPLAEQCRLHLARATALNSPSRRYSIILEELRQEAHGRAAAAAAAAAAARTDLETLQAAQSLQAVHAATPGEGGSFTAPVGSHGSLPAPAPAPPPYEVPYSMLPSPWDGWQTIDWMDIDALALDPFSGLATSPASWMSGSLPLGVFGQ